MRERPKQESRKARRWRASPSVEEGHSLRSRGRAREASLGALLLFLAACSGEPAGHPSQAPQPGPAEKLGPYEQHLRKLEKRLPGPDFHVVVEKPFVVIGNEPRLRVQQRAERTVAWAVRLLKKGYFEKDPKEILDVWLFKDKKSYDEGTLRLTGSKSFTIYGFYSSRKRALIMNIATGGGTLVHEIVHPFVEANFPACPPWFNEGLGSLYEQCEEKDGKIHGLTNWRLPGLQAAIRDRQLPSFKTLFAKDAADFYEKDKGTNYAQSRYLLYWLQEEGKLRDYYKRFVKAQKKDPSGHDTLCGLLRVKDLGDFQKRWERYVLGLRYP